MGVLKNSFCTGGLAALLLAGCATSPEFESARQIREAQIDAVLRRPLDPAEFGDTKRCLNDAEYRSYRALDDRHLLFEGRGDRQWINTLRHRCPDLRFGDVLIVRSFGGRRMCEMDTFNVADWFDWPWYRRWPWHWGSAWHTGMSCTLGKFQPVSEEQVEEIRELLERR